MARKRTVAPAFLGDETIYLLERLLGQPVRLALLGLVMQGDRRGVFEWRPLRLAADIFPLDRDVDMGAILHALHAVGIVRQYRVGSGLFGVLMDVWEPDRAGATAGLQQTIHREERASRHPSPEVEVVADTWVPPADALSVKLRQAVQVGGEVGGGAGGGDAKTGAAAPPVKLPGRPQPSTEDAEPLPTALPWDAEARPAAPAKAAESPLARAVTTTTTTPTSEGVGGGAGEDHDEDEGDWLAVRERATTVRAAATVPGPDWELPGDAPPRVQAWAGVSKLRRQVLKAVVEGTTPTDRLHFLALVGAVLDEGMPDEAAQSLCADWAGAKERGKIPDPSPRYFRQFIRGAWQEQRRAAQQIAAAQPGGSKLRSLLT